MRKLFSTVNHSAPEVAPAGNSRGLSCDWHYPLAVVLLLVLASIMRFYRIDFTELWFDEAATFDLMTDNNWLNAYLTDNAPPLYNILLRGWSRLAGYSVSALRAPSAVFGVLFVGAAIAAGTEFFNRRVGVWCGLVAALSPIHIYYSQEARNYSLLTLLLLLTYLMLWKAQRSDYWRHWVAAAICGGMALFTHYLAGLALISTMAIVWFWPDQESRHRRLKRYLILAVPIGASFLIWMLWSFVLTEHPMVGAEWIEAIWRNTPPSLAILHSLESFSFLTGPDLLESRGNFDLLLKEGTLQLSSRLLLLFFAIWAAIPYGDQSIAVPSLGRRKALLAITLFIPLILLWLVSYIKPFYVVSRYDLIGYPAFVLLAGLSLAKLQGQKVWPVFSPLICLIWFVPVGLLLQQYYFASPKAHFHRSTAALFREKIRDGDVVIFTGLRSLVGRYYLGEVGFDCKDGRCVDQSRGISFVYRLYPQVNEEAPCAYSKEALGISQVDTMRQWQDFLRLRKGASSTVWVAFDGVMDGEVMTLTYQPDIALLDAIEQGNVRGKIVASNLFVMACSVRQ